MSRINSRLLLATAAAALVIAAIGVGLSSSSPVPGKPSEANGPGVRRTPVVKAIEKALPSVVNLSTERILSRSFSPWAGGDPFAGSLDEFFKQQSDRRSYSLGSGSIIDPSGLVVTNAHVVHRAARITATLNDGRSFEAREMAVDCLNDLALLQIAAPPPDLKAIETAIPGDLFLGETVIAVGNPFGLDSSITQGVLSATARKLTFEGKTIFSDILQTDAAVYPGNSGGPLINLEGKMIGMNMAFHREAPGIGFAIPLSRLENILARWLLPERFSDGCLGIVPGVRRAPDGAVEIFLADVIKDSPAEKAGLKAGDIVASFQGKPVRDLLDFGRRLIKLKNGQSATLSVKGGRTFTLQLGCMALKDGRTLARDRLSLELQELTPQLAGALGYPFDSGLIVSDLPAGAPEGVQRGDLLARIDETTIHSEADIAKALEGKHYGDRVEAVFISVPTIKGVVYLTKKLVGLTVK